MSDLNSTAKTTRYCQPYKMNQWSQPKNASKPCTFSVKAHVFVWSRRFEWSSEFFGSFIDENQIRSFVFAFCRNLKATSLLISHLLTFVPSILDNDPNKVFFSSKIIVYFYLLIKKHNNFFFSDVYVNFFSVFVKSAFQQFGLQVSVVSVRTILCAAFVLWSLTTMVS